MSPLETALAANAVKGATGVASSYLHRLGKEKYDRFIANYTKAFTNHFNNAVTKCSTVRNILYRRQTALTKEKYVSVSFSREKNSVSDRNVLAALLNKEHLIVKGRGGAGKTMFTKWCILEIAENIQHHQKIPLYLELREIEDKHASADFHDILFEYTSDVRNVATRSQFLEGLKAGIFIIVLDAADEIKKTIRYDLVRRIERFSATFPECGILLTTRDFDEIDAISTFDTLGTQNLTKDQCVEIIKKLDYQEDTKTAIIHDITADAFAQHAFFLENPLLVTITLLTYDQSKDIPNRRSVFYKRAFEALYERHDGAKGVYRRDHHAGLPLDEFEKVFSAFCYGTYVNNALDFTDGDLVRLFGHALKECGIDEDPKLLARDAHESTCLLVREGHDFVFVHRSFQEYFAALFIKNYRGDDLADIIDAALSLGHGENVFDFLFELDKPNLDKYYVRPRLKKLLKKIPTVDSTDAEGVRRLASSMFKSLRISSSDKEFAGLQFNSNVDFSFLVNGSRAYPEMDLFKWMFPEKDKFNISSLTLDELLSFGSVTPDNSMENITTDKKYYVFKFSPSATNWIMTGFLPQALSTFSEDLRRLDKRLDDEYTGKPKTTRFNSFAKL